MPPLLENSSSSLPLTAEHTILENPPFISQIAIGLLGAFVWDIVSNIGHDYKLLNRWPIETPAVVYVISRLATLCSTFLWVLFTTTTVVDCTTIVIIERCAFPIALSTTTLLLFFRVRAIYRDNSLVIGFFLVTWLCVVVSSALEIVVDNATKVGQSRNSCVLQGKDGPFIAAGAIAPLINDILVYSAIARKLLFMVQHHTPDAKSTFRTLIFGCHLSELAKTFLQGGQIYLLAVMPTYVATIIMFSIRPHNLGYSVLTTFPTIVVANLMIGKIYRQMRLGLYSTTATTVPSGPLMFSTFLIPPTIVTREGEQQ